MKKLNMAAIIEEVKTETKYFEEASYSVDVVVFGTEAEIYINLYDENEVVDAIELDTVFPTPKNAMMEANILNNKLAKIMKAERKLLAYEG